MLQNYRSLHVLMMVMIGLVLSIAAPAEYAAAPYSDGDTFADMWVATDALGRVQPDISQTGPPKSDKQVGIFYWTWHTPQPKGPNDNTKIIAAAGDAKEIDWPANGTANHWGEPELGYYNLLDSFVIRKHASMLCDAGIDAIFFDTTNPPFTWREEYEALCREYTAMRAEGARTPAIVFIAPFGDPTSIVEQIWKDLYQPGLWSDLWFRWEGKPLLLADKKHIKDPAILDFFTFRKPMPDYWIGPNGPEQWSWLEVFPQHVFRNAKDEAEQMSVGLAQNALPNTPGPAPMSDVRGAMGRSWHNGAKDSRPDAVNYGFNFEEQWTRALEVNPKFIFVTGWNEWTAGRYTEWSKYTDATSYYPAGLFVDEYTQEYSRDCEPMRGGHTDNYYYQLASWVRRFKGVRPRPEATGPSAITIDGAFTDWADVAPEYRDTIGDTVHRNHRGYGDVLYTNETGRNDFVILKAAYDEKSLFFYAQTKAAITPYTDPHWMLLLIDADKNASTGWLGYDYAVNLQVKNAEETSVSAWRQDAWETIGAAQWRKDGNGLELAVPRALTGQAADAPAFDFHWADNIQGFSDVSELGVNGDSAPNRRWNYRFTAAKK